MKKILLILCLVLGTGITVAQRDQIDKKDKIKTLMVTHISKDLTMNAQEAEKFWPVFHISNDRIDDLRGKKRNVILDLKDKLSSLSDTDAQKYISDLEAIDSEIEKIEDRSKREIIKIIGAKRFLVLKHSEMKFRRNMLEEFKERKEKRGKQP
jgi:hypothetical protein